MVDIGNVLFMITYGRFRKRSPYQGTEHGLTNELRSWVVVVPQPTDSQSGETEFNFALQRSKDTFVLDLIYLPPHIEYIEVPAYRP